MFWIGMFSMMFWIEISMECLKCNGETKLLECENSGNICYRSYRCLECDYVFSTIEKSIDDYMFYKYANGYEKLLDAVKRLGKKDWLK